MRRHDMANNPVASLPGRLHELLIPGGLRTVLYQAAPIPGFAHAADATPLLLVHSVNAAASAFEMEPLYIRQALHRPVFALDLPGFAAADKPDILYTPQLMRDAIAAAMDWIAHNVTAAPIDIVALSLACEFAAEAVLQQPLSVRSMALVSPSGMEGRRAGEKYDAGRTRQSKLALKMLRSTAFGRGLYRLLTTRASMRWFLSRTWGTRHFDRRLLEHSRECAALPGAEHMPLQFVSGGLFTRGIIERYRALPVPVWVAHGHRGSFTDFRGCPVRTGAGTTPASYAVERTVFDAGAMPHFELPDVFDKAYQRFLSRIAHTVASPVRGREPGGRAMRQEGVAAAPG
jgi:pimeloyl-ACP methyl ester carboxylesterase